jgi:hypothetical protein
MKQLLDVTAARIDELRNELLHYSEEVEVVREVQGRIAESLEATEHFQEYAVEMARAGAEIESALAEVALESSKLRSDALKQQATFAGGALVGTAAVAEGLLPKEQVAQPLLWASYGILLVTICASLLLLHLEARGTERLLSTGERQHESRIVEVAYWASVAGLPLAVLTFVAFAAVNVL